MATEQEIILKVGTDEAVKSVGDLKENIKLLKSSLNDLEIGSEEYTETLNTLKLNQNALKDAMYATSSSMGDVALSAAGMSESYNSLVHRMAALKEEWRAANDQARRDEIGAQIAEINQQLKEMDASVGNYQRNVGNYEGALQKLAGGFMATAGGAGSLINPIKNVTMGFKALSTTPVIAILGLLANVISGVIKNLQSSEENTNRLTVAFAPLKTSATIMTKTFQWLGDKLADVAEWMTKVLGKLGLISELGKELQDITKEEVALVEKRRKVERENADAQLEIAKLKAQAAEKDKYTAAERLEFIEAAAKKEREIADRNIEIARREYDVLKRKSDLAGNSAKENDELSNAYVKLQNAETDYFNKSKELSAQRVEAINAIKAETAASEKLLKSKKDLETFTIKDETDADIEAALAEEQKYMDQLAREQQYEIDLYLQRRAAEKAEREARTQAAHEEAMAHAKQLWEEQEREREAAEERKQLRISGLMDVAAATSDILGSIADSMEVNNEKEFKRQQGLQIAQVTINTLAGAVGAFMQAMSTYPAPAGAIIGAVQAAAATAAGIAQIAKIKQQKYSKDGSSSGSASSGSVAAPNIQTNIPTQRTLTSASEEDRLNRMAAPTRAYIVDSDLQAKEQERETVETETSF